MEDTSRETRPAGRELPLLAFGDTASEIELTVLDRARAFFGEDVRLEVVRDYKVWTADGGPLESQADGKAYYARVVVRTVEP